MGPLSGYSDSCDHRNLALNQSTSYQVETPQTSSREYPPFKVKKEQLTSLGFTGSKITFLLCLSCMTIDERKEYGLLRIPLVITILLRHLRQEHPHIEETMVIEHHAQQSSEVSASQIQLILHCIGDL